MSRLAPQPSNVTDGTVGLKTLQFSRGGLFDSEPVDGYKAHLVRATSRGTPGPTLCGIDRFAEGSAGWSVGGGITGPGIVHTPCDGCVAEARKAYPGLPVTGIGGEKVADVTTRPALSTSSRPQSEAVHASRGRPQPGLRPAR